MYVKMNIKIKKDCQDPEPPIAEICEFKAIRWNPIGFVTVYTNHARHVYMMPLEREEYEELEKQIESAFIKNATLFAIGGDFYRIPRDSFTLTKEKSADWSVDIIATAAAGGGMPPQAFARPDLIKEL